MDFDALHQDMVRRYKPHLVCGPDTDLVIEGYPRSSNSFTIWMLEVLQGQGPYLRIAHHIHAIENLRLGVHFGKPLVVLARPAEDAILSYIIYSDRSVEFATERYEQFFPGVLSLPVRPVVIPFEIVTGDFNKVVTRINTAIAGRGLRPVPFSQDLAADTKAASEIARQQAEIVHGDKKDLQVAVPNAVREEIKAARRAEVQAYLARRPGVARLYDKVLAHGI